MRLVVPELKPVRQALGPGECYLAFGVTDGFQFEHGHALSLDPIHEFVSCCNT